MFKLCELKGLALEPHPNDQGLPGQFNACHAEKQLIPYVVEKHLFLQSELDMLEEPEDGIEDWLALLAIGRLTEHECAQRERSRERRHRSRKIANVSGSFGSHVLRAP